jgi:hypothetical protein
MKFLESIRECPFCKQTGKRKFSIVTLFDDEVDGFTKHYLFGELIPFLSNYAGGNPFLELFFKNQQKRFDGVGETAIPGSIRSWLDCFFLSQRQYSPSLLVSENDFGEFTLDVAIDQDGEAVLLKDILRDEKMAAQRFKILKELSLLASLIKGLEMYINR